MQLIIVNLSTHYVGCGIKAGETLFGKIDEHCPASILRLQDNAVLYLDKDSAEKI